MTGRKKYCCIPACENNRGTVDPNIRLYRLPSLADVELRAKWAQAIKELFGIDFKTSSPLICSQHFAPEDVGSGCRLRTGAVPTIGIKSNTSTEPTTSSAIKIEPMETLDVSPFTYVNINEIREHKDTAKNTINKQVSISVRPIKSLQKANLGHCVQCAEYTAKLEKSNQRNEEIMTRYEGLLRENRRLKAYIKYLKERGLTTDKQMKTGRCHICNVELALGEKHLCMDVKVVTCEYCSRPFKTTFDLCEHLQVAKHIETIYECDECPMVFSAATLLAFHRQSGQTHKQIQNPSQEQTQIVDLDMDVPLTDKIFTCAICDESFKHSAELKAHMTEIHVNRNLQLEHKPIPVDTTKIRFECYLCKIECKSKLETQRHLKLHVAARDKKCVICQENLTANEIDCHVCFEENSIDCDYCRLSLNATAKLLEHLENAHDDRTIYQCRKCPRYFGMTKLRKWHEKEHKDIPKQFACHLCEKKFAYKYLLRTHMDSHITEVNFLCSECGKGCKTAQQLSIHMRVHSEKKIKCPDCPGVFGNLQLFKYHRELHMNLKYKCNECKSTFTCKRYLATHIKRKHRRLDSAHLKKFECTECPLKFDKLPQLSVHMRKHTGEKPFTCEFCEKKYAYKQDYMKHMQTHVGNAIYQCDKCPQAFRLLIELRKHSYTHYKEQTTSQE